MTNDTIDIQEIADIARQAGAVLMSMRDAVRGKEVYKQDGSPVTEADKRSSAIVCEGLAALTPHIPVISEENPMDENYAIMASSDACWVVDPLDGTRSYISGHDGFGVHIGLIRDGAPVIGVIYFPAEGVLYYTDGVNGAFRQKDGAAPERIFVGQPFNTGGELRVAASWVKERQPKIDVPCKLLPLVGGGRVCAAAENSADIAFIDGPFAYWDVGASHALLKAAGGELYELATGNPITYPKNSLIIPPSIGGNTDTVLTFRERFLAAVKNLKPRPEKKKKGPEA